MSSAAAAQPPHAVVVRAGADAGARSAWLTRENALVGGLLAIGFFALFFRWFVLQHQHSFGSPDWSHAYIVPLISGYIVWRRRRELAAIRPEVFWPGLAPLLVGVASYAYWVLGFPNHMLQGFSIVIALGGLVLLMTGPRALPILAFPIAYLAFGVTIAEMVMLKVTAKLQLVASAGANVLMKMLAPLFGYTVDLWGNVLTITKRSGEVIPLNVAEACSGLRMLVAFYALGAAVAFISCRHWWQRIALLLLAGPIAVLVNVLRVAFLGIASTWNPELSRGNAHMFIGVLWLVPAFLLFMGVVWALNRMVREQPAQTGGGS